MKIYLDNAATTPLDAKVFEAMKPYLASVFGNASSIHYAGLEAKKAVDEAKGKIAAFLGCLPEEVYFTSGATESDNMAVFGLLEALGRQKNAPKTPQIVVSAIEHDAILEPAKELQKIGVEVTFLQPDAKGIISAESLISSIKENTVFVSIMYANNEIGVIEPIAELARVIKDINAKRDLKIYFHTDATQAAGYLPMDVKKLGADMLSFSGHKIYGPKGIGVFYLKKGTPFKPQVFGGGQQNGIRPGTYNVAGIAGLAKAVELIIKNSRQEAKKIKELRDYLLSGIKSRIPKVSVNGDLKKRLPSNANVIFAGAEGESILLMLSQKGIAASTGSACSSGSLEPSHVLTAIGVKPELAHGSIRFSLGKFNTKKEMDYLLKVLPDIISKLRKMSPLKD